MSDTVVSLLTAPGTGAIATVEVRGPRASELAKQLFTPAGKPLPESPELHRFWFGTLGNDEVILAVTSNDTIEVHCHGGRRVVRWVIDQFLANGCIEERTPRPKGEGFDLLQRAPTLRTANIILDQLNGAFVNEVRRILALIETDSASVAEPLHQLADRGITVGRHLVEPWKVVFAGPPNVGKSSLINALAGFQRSVVSEVAGTTRDVVSLRVAFDGWLVELIDTAGLREADELEAEGIKRAKEALFEADCAVWVVDASDPQSHFPGLTTGGELFVVANKCDLPPACHLSALPSFDGTVRARPVSARTGVGLTELLRALLDGIPDVKPGAAVPFTPRLIELIRVAAHCEIHSRWDQVSRLLCEALAEAESHYTAGPSALPSKP